MSWRDVLVSAPPFTVICPPGGWFSELHSLSSYWVSSAHLSCPWEGPSSEGSIHVNYNDTKERDVGVTHTNEIIYMPDRLLLTERTLEKTVTELKTSKHTGIYLVQVLAYTTLEDRANVVSIKYTTHSAYYGVLA